LIALAKGGTADNGDLKMVWRGTSFFRGRRRPGYLIAA
jgi:hypothetical protein